MSGSPTSISPQVYDALYTWCRTQAVQANVGIASAQRIEPTIDRRAP